MVQETMDILFKHVNKLVNHTYTSHYKMVMEELDNVSVKMILIMLEDMELQVVELQEDNGVIIFIKIQELHKILKLHKLLNNSNNKKNHMKLLELIKTQEIEH